MVGAQTMEKEMAGSTEYLIEIKDGEQKGKERTHGIKVTNGMERDYGMEMTMVKEQGKVEKYGKIQKEKENEESMENMVRMEKQGNRRTMHVTHVEYGGITGEIARMDQHTRFT